MFIPIGDDNSKRHLKPLVVWLIFAANVYVWYLQFSVGETFTYGFSAVPYELMHATDLVGQQVVIIEGKRQVLHQAPGPSPIYLTLLSSMFMHGSWMHIIGNMAYLLIFADQIEDLLGHVKFLFFYLLCGLAASVAHVAADPNSTIPCLGASGAIAGVLGAYLLMYPRNHVHLLVFHRVMLVPSYIVLGGWIFLQLLSQVSVKSGGSGVAYMAHIGGFAAGAILILLFKHRERRLGHLV
ncbi:MAG: rhomboid family intramembrane serine protease [Bdellovibrionales bacterium]|nr:rhomboid family intramembrane serine protease [Bdellovibrionales bacterium]